MQSAAQYLPGFRELDHRANDGIDVWLLWRPLDDRLVVAVTDAKSGDAFTVEVAAHERPLDVFHHPYAYAGRAAGTQAHDRLEVCGGKRRAREQPWDRQ